jgi:hypothetical protein
VRVAVMACAVISSLAPRLGRTAVRPPVSLEHLLESQLRGVESGLSALCEPRCGTVVLDGPSPVAGTAEARPITKDSTLVSYDEHFMQRLRDTYGESVTYFVLAHEYGHHLDREPASGWTHELRADALAGCALVRDGRSLEPSLVWMRREHFLETMDEVLGDKERLETVLSKYIDPHPPWIYRIEASRRGAELCTGAPTLPRFLAGISNAPEREEESARTALAADSPAWRAPSSAERAFAAPSWGVVLVQPKRSRF